MHVSICVYTNAPYTGICIHAYKSGYINMKYIYVYTYRRVYELVCQES